MTTLSNGWLDNDADLQAAYEALGPRFRQEVEQASHNARRHPVNGARSAAPRSFERVTLPPRRRAP